jgi:Fur family transcriptional regulator, peroxide stress response regulator
VTIELEVVIKLLREHSCRITPQRIDVVKYILKTGSHPSAEDIHKVIKKRYPMISLATVYKTLDLLKRLYIVQELGFADKSARYETNNKAHINMVCMSCGKISDVDGVEGLSELESQARNKSSYHVLSSRFELHGYCPSCKSKRNRKNEYI